jgi:8-oxo-dGTP pyrophosphatase MutT (NUDIX family)
VTNKQIFTPHQLTKNVKLLHKVAIVIDGRILVLRRAADSKTRPNCWDLSGGNSEWPVKITTPTRDLYQTDIAREIEEETGIKVPAERFNLKSLVYFSTFYEPEKKVYTVICGWKLDLADKSLMKAVTLSHEHTEFEWIAKKDLKDYDFGGKKGEFVANIINQAFADLK